MIITFTNVIGAIRNAISSVITTNLKMWLGFETSETLGREEVVNGDFSDGTTGWSPFFNASLTIDNQRLAITPTTSSSSRATQGFTTQVGKTYLINADFDNPNSSEVLIGLSPNSNGSGATYDTSTQSSGSISVLYTATTTTTYVSLSRFVNDTKTIYYDNVSVKLLSQITPDKSGNNNVGELFTGKAIELDGVNDNVDIDFTTPIKSAVFWVKPLDTGVQSILGFGGAFSGSKYIKSINNNIQSAGLSTVSVYVNGVSTTSVPLDQWSRVVVNFALLTPQELKFGFGFNSYGNIQLSDVQLYNENLSTDDIAYDYANPNKLAIDNPSTSLSVTNLKGYWALSEGDGLVAYDSGTNLEEEEVVDGNFPTGTTAWVENDWTISNNVAASGNTSSLLQQTNVFINSTGVYKSTFKARSVNGTNVTLRFYDGLNEYETFTITSSDFQDFTLTRQRAGDNSTLYIFNNSNAEIEISNVSVRELTASDHGGIVNGATYVDAQPRIPQLGMQNWSKGSNLYLNSEPTSNEAAAGDITYASYSWNYIGFKNATVFGDNSLTRFRYGGSVTLGLEYTLSAFVIMDDNSEPDITNTSSSGDFGIVLGNAVTGGTNTKTNVSGNIWRVSKTKTVSLTTTNNGIIKYTTQSSKGFKVVGWQLEESSSASAYRLTDGAATLNSTVIPNPTIPTKDILGNAVRDRLNSFNLDGSGYAEVADNDSLDMSSGFSTSFWIKLDEGSTTTDYDFLVCKGRGISGFNATYGFGTTYYNNLLIATIYTSADKNQLSFSNESPTGQWVFLCVTFEPNTTNGFKFYKIINNQTYIESMTTSGTVDESHNLNVGRDSSFVTTRQSKNIISDVLFYDSVLTSNQIENNYNAGLSAHTN